MPLHANNASDRIFMQCELHPAYCNAFTAARLHFRHVDMARLRTELLRARLHFQVETFWRTHPLSCFNCLFRLRRNRQLKKKEAGGTPPRPPGKGCAPCNPASDAAPENLPVRTPPDPRQEAAPLALPLQNTYPASILCQ